MERAVVEELTAVIDDAAELDLDTLSDRQLDAELVGLIKARHRLDAQIARRCARWDARTVWLADGSRSPAARLSRDAKLAAGSAKQILRRGRATAVMPATTEAWASGEIGGDHVDLLAGAAGSGRGDLFASDEPMLVEHCVELSHRQATKTVQYWCQRADAELQSDGTPPPPATSLRIGVTFGGGVSGDFTLDPIGGATVTESLRRIERDLYRQDRRAGVTRSKPERLAAALVEMAVRAHAAPEGGRRPEPLVCILAGEATLEQLCEMATGTVIAPDVIVPHLDHTDVQTFIFDGADHVIAASPSRTFRGMLRRAIQVRDRHCQHPAGCDAPIVECDVDHVTPHTAGGVTDEPGGQLQCEPHNRKSDLHARAPADVIAAAHHRREHEATARQRLQALLADHHQRPPPDTAA